MTDPIRHCVERMDGAIMRTTKPRAIPTILRLIDWLNMVLGSWQLGKKSASSTLFGPTYHNRDEARVPHQHVRRPSYCSPGGIRQQRVGDRRSDRRIVNCSACDSRTL